MLSDREAFRTLAQLSARQAARLLQECGSPRAAAARSGLPVPRTEEPYLARSDPDYPLSLLQLTDPPSVLFYRGRLPGPAAVSVAVVGTRSASNYGLSFATRLGRELSAAGVTVISGMARGIDGAAHRGSLEGSAGLPTLAVLACGLDGAYPPEHAALQRTVGERGGLLTEYPRGTGVQKWHFPARNRLVAALAAAVVVVEAPLRSGALITADHALDLGKEVLVVPGPVGWRQSEGTLALLKDGATLVRDAQDVLDALGYVRPPVPSTPRDPLLEAVSPLGSTTDELQAATGLAVPELLARLTGLQVAKRLARAPDGRWVAS